MSALEEMSEKLTEARGKLTNLIFRRKTKKPKEQIQAILQYLQWLNAYQAQQQQQQQQFSNGQRAVSPTGTPLVSPLVPLAGTLPPALALHAPEGISEANTLTIPAASPISPASGAAPDAAVPPSITAELDAIVTSLYGDTTAGEGGAKDPDPKVARELLDLMFEHDLFQRLLDQSRALEFEARKFFTRIFEYAMTQRRELGVPYMLKRKHMILTCIRSYDEKDVSVALSCDAILRACIVCEPITEMILASGSLPDTAPLTPSSAAALAAAAATAAPTTNGAADPSLAAPAVPDSSATTATLATPTLGSLPASPGIAPLSLLASSGAKDAATAAAAAENTNMVLPFFRYLDLPTFINSHAFATFKLLLTSFPTHAAAYLRSNYDSFFPRYNRLLAHSDNYLTKVQSFSFLGELLMERANQEVMMRYVNESENLKISMLALRGPKAIQLAVFNVLKVFVPNPFKSDAVARMLTQNKRTFLAFLDEFEKESEDETLIAHKAEMTHALLELPDSVPPPLNSQPGTRKASAEIGSNGTVVNGAQQQQQPQQQSQQQQQPAAAAEENGSQTAQQRR